MESEREFGNDMKKIHFYNIPYEHGTLNGQKLGARLLSKFLQVTTKPYLYSPDSKMEELG